MRNSGVCLFLALGLVPRPALAQVHYTQPGSIYRQTFDTLEWQETGNGTPYPWADNQTLPGWYASRIKNNMAYEIGDYRADDGTDNTGGLYSFGSKDNTERALGSITSNALGDITYGVRILNDTGRTLERFTLVFRGEQWRAGGNMDYQNYQAGYRVGDVGLFTTHYGMGFTGPQIGGPLALDGNAMSNSRLHFLLAAGLNWKPGQALWLVWYDYNDSDNDHALAIDDVVFRAYTKPPTAVKRPGHGFPGKG